LAQGDFTHSLFNIGRDGCVADEVPINKKVEALDLLASRGGLDQNFMAGQIL
jgi:hypothetical protein